jgi:hypothetical protein
MNMTSSLANTYWLLGALGGACLVGLAAGFNLTLGTGRRIGLPLITVCGAILAALGLSFALLLLQ